MEVYIFSKNRRCPYLHYAFLISEVEQYVNEHLDWNSMEHKVDIPFLHQWLHDAQVLYNNIDTTPPTKTKRATVEKVTISDFREKVYIGTVGDNFYKEWFKIVQEV